MSCVWGEVRWYLAAFAALVGAAASRARRYPVLALEARAPLGTILPQREGQSLFRQTPFPALWAILALDHEADLVMDAQQSQTVLARASQHRLVSAATTKG